MATRKNKRRGIDKIPTRFHKKIVRPQKSDYFDDRLFASLSKLSHSEQIKRLNRALAINFQQRRRRRLNPRHIRKIINTITELQNQYLWELSNSDDYAPNLEQFLNYSLSFIKHKKMSFKFSADDLYQWLDAVTMVDNASLPAGLLRVLGQLSFEEGIVGSLDCDQIDSFVASVYQNQPTLDELAHSMYGLRLLTLMEVIDGSVNGSILSKCVLQALSAPHSQHQVCDILYNFALILRANSEHQNLEAKTLKIIQAYLTKGVDYEHADTTKLAIICCYLDLDMPKVLQTKHKQKAPQPQAIQTVLALRLKRLFPRSILEIKPEKLLGAFFVDLYLATDQQQKIVVEIDGPQHYRQHQRLRKKDTLRDNYLSQTWGSEVLRYKRIGTRDNDLINSIIDDLMQRNLLSVEHEASLSQAQTPPKTYTALANNKLGFFSQQQSANIGAQSATLLDTTQDEVQVDEENYHLPRSSQTVGLGA